MVDREKLTVLAFPGPGQSTNPYIDLLYEALEREGVSVDAYTTVRALSNRYDVLHVHWPELALRRAHRRPIVINALQFVLTVGWLKLRGTRVVWTLHNLRPHEDGSSFSNLFLQWFSRTVDGWITPSDRAHLVGPQVWPALKDVPSTVVPHGHYRAAYPPPPGKTEARRMLGLPADDPVLLFFGRIRGYKGVSDLLSAFAQTEVNATLVVAGLASERSMEQELRSAAAGDPRVRLLLDFIDEERVPVLFGASDVVVLPFRNVTHSGSVMLALSLNRPVLVPDTPVMRELQDVVGHTWVTTYAGPLRPADLTAALETEHVHAQGPNLSWADWAEVGGETARFLRPIAT